MRLVARLIQLTWALPTTLEIASQLEGHEMNGPIMLCDCKAQTSTSHFHTAAT